MEDEPWNDRDPEEVDKEARRIVEIADLDDEDFPQAPNDFEECVEFIRDRVLLTDPRERDERLDDLIFHRGVKKIMDKYDLDEEQVQIRLIEERGGEVSG